MRWEDEKPSWFTEPWKARIPPELLEGIDATPLRRASGSMLTDDPAESKLRRAVRDAPPWCLDAIALANCAGSGSSARRKRSGGSAWL